MPAMERIGMLLWSLLVVIPLVIMVALDGFCSGRELCRAGLTFTLLLYGIGIAVFLVSVLIARLILQTLHAPALVRVRTMKALFLIPLIPPLIVLGLLFAGLLGRLS